MSDSSLVSYTKISPNKSLRAYRNASSTGKISKITIHHMAGCISVESCGSWFAQSNAQCSSNYGIDSTGKIALYVPEKYRSWCSSNGDNDNIAITIEVANSKSGNPWPVSDKALAACIDLCVDICQRNGIEKLVYTGTKSGNLTRHDMFSNKVCPGPYLGGKFPYIVEQVNARLGKPLEITASSVKPTIQKGDTSAYVSKLQEILMGLGYNLNVSAPTGYFGTNTDNTVRAFQKANNLEVDGIVGPKTWAKLFSKDAIGVTTQKETTTTVSTTSDEETIWNFLYQKLGNAYGVAGLMGNLKAESALRSTNLQNTYEKSLGMTDDQYTAAVDAGTYTNFVKDGAGYGLAQWTYYTRKQNLLNYAKTQKVSIGNLNMQLDFLWKELSESYTGTLSALKKAASVKDASDVVLTQFERPKNQDDTVKATRASYGQTYYDKYAKKTTTTTTTTTVTTNLCTAAKVIAVAAAEVGYKEKASNSSLDSKTANAGSANYTKYARDFDQKYPKWYNGKKNGYAWCDMFVDWCFLTAFGYNKALSLLCQPEYSCGAGCTHSLQYYKAKGQFYTKNPKPGDQIFFGTSLSNSSHTGLVESVDSKYVYTIEGNTSNQVARKSYSLSNANILGYGRPAYDKDDFSTTSSVTQSTPFLVRVTSTHLNIRTGPGTNYSTTGNFTGAGTFTIVQVSSGQGSTAGWGKLKSGVGWISLDYAEKI